MNLAVHGGQLCTTDVLQYPPGSALAAEPVRGVQAYLAAQRQALRHYQHTRFEQVLLYPTPTGIAARYLWRWEAPDGTPKLLATSLTFRLEGEHIRQIGSSGDAQRLRALLAHQAEQHPREASRASHPGA